MEFEWLEQARVFEYQKSVNSVRKNSPRWISSKFCHQGIGWFVQHQKTESPNTGLVKKSIKIVETSFFKADNLPEAISQPESLIKSNRLPN